MGNKITLRERIRAVEVEIENFRGTLKEVQKTGSDVAKQVAKVENHLSELTRRFDDFESALNQLSPTLSGRDKAAIRIAVISGIVSIIVSIVTTLPLVIPK